MRRIRYAVAMSLDGYIAGPEGQSDWIVMDPDIDFGAMLQEFDSVLVGRRTFEGMAQAGNDSMPGMKIFVFSRTLTQSDYPKVTIVAEKPEQALSSLRKKSGKDIWLLGGGSLFRSLLNMGYVDTVEVTVIPILLGGGIPLLPATATRTKLRLTGHRVYKSGVVSLVYALK